VAVAGDIARPRVREAPHGLRFDLQWSVIAGATVLVAWLTLVPLAFLIWQSFMTPQTAQRASVFTLRNYVEAYSSADTYSLFINSVQFASGTAIFALALGTFLAWMNERTNTPFKSLFYALSIIPLVVPGILFVVAWIMLASPKIGLINLVLRALFDTDATFVDVYSMPGMIIVDGLHYAPIAFLLMTAAFRAMDPSLEESAMMSGATTWQIATRITLRLAWPAVAASFLILFVRSIESFEVPALLGLPVGIEVFTSAIYDAIHRYPSDIGLACAYALALLVITSGGIWFQARIASQGSKYSTVTGKGFRPRVIDLGRTRWIMAAIFLFYAFIAIAMPFFILIWSSLQRYYSVPSWAALQNVSLRAYWTIIGYPNVSGAIWNSFILSVGTATFVMLLTAVIAWIVVRTKIPGRWLLDNMATLPMVMPGLVLGLAIMICYLTVGGGIYGTIWILFIAYLTRFLPYGMRYNSTSMVQIHRELEESAAMSGASWGQAFVRIVLPLLKPGLVAGWIYVVIVSVRELSSSILLYSPGSEVVSVIIWELWQNGQYVELSAFGVMLISALFVFALLAQAAGRRFGVKEV
jgi:iron(III) transport system permease protein